MLRLALRVARPYWLAPWRSALLRWRIETYGALDGRGRLLSAAAMTRRDVLRFCVRNRRQLWRFVRWAARLDDEC